MSKPKPQLFLDTDACILAAKLDESSTRRFWRHLFSTYRYAISPMTMVELLIKQHRGSDAYFQRNRHVLNVLHGTRSKVRMLPLPGAFLFQRVLGIETGKPEFSPRQLYRWLVAAIRARTRSDLHSVVLPGGSGLILHALDISTIESDMQDGREDNAKKLETARTEKRACPEPLPWAAGLLGLRGLDPTIERCQLIAASTKAAYQHDRFLWTMARNDTYDFRKHQSDWIDRQQLLYLADPQNHFLTNDRKLVRKIADSGQESQVLELRDFYKCAGLRA